MGDALGTTVEFMAPGTFDPMIDMVGGGYFGLEAGQWTDDTSMALCLAESLITCQGFDPIDQLTRYDRWMREGYLSSTGSCFDVGNATREALLRFELTGAAYCGSDDPLSAGNGSIMRLAPVPMFYSARPEEAVRYAALSSRTTHAAAECEDACRLLASYVIAALHGWTKEQILKPGAFGEWLGLEPLSPKIEGIRKGSFLRKEPPIIKGSGYVVKSLEAALWAFAKSATFEDGALLAVNLGDDADTTGAVYGQLAGSYYGMAGIPGHWLNKLAKLDLIEILAQNLFIRNEGGTLK